MGNLPDLPVQVDNIKMPKAGTLTSIVLLDDTVNHNIPAHVLCNKWKLMTALYLYLLDQQTGLNITLVI